MGSVRSLGRDGMDALLAELSRRDYELVGPTVRDVAVVFDRMAGAEGMAGGVIDEPYVDAEGLIRSAEREPLRLREAGVRHHDPCISCATHRTHLHVQR